jgi:hypothetical protein
MRLTLSLFDLFHPSESAKGKAPARSTPGEKSTPLAEMEDSVPTMGLWSGAMMLLALGFSSRNRLPHRQRAAGMAKRARRRDA